jgi:hypothetical protein
MNKSNNKGEKKRKFGEWFFKRQKKEVEKLIDKMDIKAEDIKIMENKEQKKEEIKCVCGEQETFGGEVEIGGICHRTENPCYVLSTPPKALREEELREVKKRIAYEIGLIYPLDKDGLYDFVDKFVPKMIELLKQDRERIKERVEGLKNRYHPCPAIHSEIDGMEIGYNQAIMDILQILDEEQL